MSSASARQLVDELRQVRLYQIYDYFLTFTEEVELVWASRWTVMKTAFLFDRYLFVPNLIIQLLRLAQAYTYLSLFGVYLSGCTLNNLGDWVVPTLTQPSIAILCLRLWVMWNKDKKFLSCVFDVSKQRVDLSFIVSLVVDIDGKQILIPIYSDAFTITGPDFSSVLQAFCFTFTSVLCRISIFNLLRDIGRSKCKLLSR
ncbi:hypothetical protein P691DRAFT_788633 [Macrolepiota fuliginosa MF-IS2]|uniref:DUF6533 domain-containing protein n=1 Tax=Macrolepiota fuliginosa MF-IS2 TaxID=1400762 RepID=A0A9P5X198_9AGAR|nr:hypothetical protein P691DRAFT_788633 [Macrolepiota fuliginosa MF-IS2]